MTVYGMVMGPVPLWWRMDKLPETRMQSDISDVSG